MSKKKNTTNRAECGAATTKRNKKNTKQSTAPLTCSKQWTDSMRPKTVVIVAERTNKGYSVKSATVRVAINQYSKTAVPISDLQHFVEDINTKGIRL